MLVAGRAILGFLVHALAEAVLCGPGAEQEIGCDRAQRVVRTPLPEILGRLPNRVVRVALDVGDYPPRMPGEAGDGPSMSSAHRTPSGPRDRDKTFPLPHGVPETAQCPYPQTQFVESRGGSLLL
jgi:hypothetical protein